VSEFFKNKRKLTATMVAFFLAVTLLAGTVAHLSGEGLGQFTGKDGAAKSEEPEQAETIPAASLQKAGAREEAVHYNIPAEMRGVYLVPGADFMTSEDLGEEAIKGEIDAALQNAQDLMLNTVIIETVYGDSVLFKTANLDMAAGFDVMEYIVSRCREENLYAYAIFDESLFSSSGGGATTALRVGAPGGLSTLSQSAASFAETYQVDGILLDGYQSDAEAVSYGLYRAVGGGIGYQNYLRQTPQAAVKTAAKAIRKNAPGTQVGLLADAVWANRDEEEGGSDTKAQYTALYSGNADTKAFVESGLVDFVAVKAYGAITDSSEPFIEVVNWWAGLAAENDVSMYVVHASEKICTDQPGWKSHDQLTAQVINASDLPAFGGSIFNSLSRMVEDPNEATTTLLKYYREEVEPEQILTELAVTKPEQTTYTTFEPVATFTGASDPNSKVTINGEEIKTDASGYFTVAMDLSAGSNQFVIEHKEKTITYNITRQVQVLKEISPTGSLTTDGGMSVTITALAYQDATVSASINGSTVSMYIDESAQTEDNRDSSYSTFVGEYTVPAATSSIQNLGNIVVHATWQGESDSMQGAGVKVNKKAQVADGVPVVVVADQARTYPSTTLNNVANPDCYPLPKGAMDYAVGDEIVYNSDGKTYVYQVLASGLRVQSQDIQASSDYASGNVISGMEVENRDGCTYLTLKTAQKISYTFRYSSEGVEITFHNTTSVPGNLKLTQNPIFSSADWKDATLSLRFNHSKGFMGYKGYFDSNGNLVFRFNNPPSSISGARIAVDAGHGGGDPGALGFLADYPERVINYGIAEKLVEELQSRGATVLFIDSSSKMTLENRVAQAESFNADLFISVHNNTANSASAAGTEVYYHHGFSGTLAATASSKVSGQLNTTNRGAKNSYFQVTLSSQFQSVLVECGFLSNKNEYEKLIKNKYQARIAAGIADSISAAISAAYSGGGGSGVESVGGAVDTSAVDDPSEDANSAAGPTAGADLALTLSQDELTMAVGDEASLEVYSSDDSTPSVTWQSDDEEVATVSSSGKVTARGEGMAAITAATEDGVYAECLVIVAPEYG